MTAGTAVVVALALALARARALLRRQLCHLVLHGWWRRGGDGALLAGGQGLLRALQLDAEARAVLTHHVERRARAGGAVQEPGRRRRGA